MQFEPEITQTVGRNNLELNVPKLDMQSEVAHASPTDIGMEIRPSVMSSATRDGYSYRHFNIKPKTHYCVEVRGADGHLKWAEDFSNLVTSEGLNAVMDAAFGAGLATPAWFIGLADGQLVDGQAPAYSVVDVMSSHAGWIEFTDYDEQTRGAFVPGPVVDGSLDNGASRIVVSINAPGKVAGCFLSDDSAIGSTDGKLYGVGGFSGGTRDVEEGDTLHITSTLSAGD